MVRLEVHAKLFDFIVNGIVGVVAHFCHHFAISVVPNLHIRITVAFFICRWQSLTLIDGDAHLESFVALGRPLLPLRHILDVKRVVRHISNVEPHRKHAGHRWIGYLSQS